jgi:hypothetical protein
MIGKVTVALAMVLAAVHAKSGHHHHHVNQLKNTTVIYDEYFHDCIGCDVKSYYFCGDRNSTQFGKCSSAPLPGCERDTW